MGKVVDAELLIPYVNVPKQTVGTSFALKKRVLTSGSVMYHDCYGALRALITQKHTEK